jgi:sugar diacid utilization regulator
MDTRRDPELRAELAVALEEILSSLASDLPARQAMDLIVRHVAQLAGFDFCGVLLPETAGERVRLAGSYAFPADYADRLSNVFSIPVSDDALSDAPTRLAFEQSRTIVVPDVQHYPSEQLNALARQYGYRSMVSVPLRLRGEVIGVVNGYSAEVRHYSDGQLHAIEMLAGSAAVAVSLAALVDDQHVTISQLRELNQQLERQRWVLERAQEIHGRLTQAVIEGSGFERVAQTLSELIERPVAVWDGRIHLICATDDEFAAQLGPALRSPDIRRQLLERVSSERAAVVAGEGLGASRQVPRTIVSPIKVGGEQLGYVTVPEAGREASDLELRAVEQAATVFALEIVKGRVARETEDRLRSDFLLDLLESRYESTERLEERARHHGLDVHEEHRVLVLDLDDWDGYQRRRGLTVSRATTLRSRVLRVGQEVLVRAWPGCLVHVGVEGLIATCPTSGRSEVPAALAATVEEIQRRVGRTAPQLTVSAGVGASASAPEEFAASFAGANQCLRLLRALSRPGRVLSVDDLGVVRLLLDTREPEELTSFARRLLGPVLDYGSHAGPELRRTLDCYLEQGGDVKATARRMLVHANTVKYRLQRVEELCGIKLRDPNDLVQVTVASIVVRLLEGGEDVLATAR